jgi:flagellar protein FliO/FliZ
MDGDVLLRFLMALIFTLSLIGLLYWLVRRYAPSRLLTPAGSSARLRVLEVHVLDARHRLVLIRRDSVEHLLLLGAQSDLVVEGGIVAADAPAAGSFREQLDGQTPRLVEGTSP